MNLMDDLKRTSEIWTCKCGNEFWEEKGKTKSTCPKCNQSQEKT